MPHLEGAVSAVGGVVRDALLGRAPGDELDLVVEGDAVAVALDLGRALGARVVAHPRFGTATIVLPHGGHLDLVGARTETYAAPGALPNVEPGTLLDDLERRDFTINAMALRLSGPGTGALIDPRGGVPDLGARLIRALRPDAFTEDPSRLVRAARYAARLGFDLAPETDSAARAAALGLDVASVRVAEELRRVLVEPDAVGALAILRALGVPWIRADAAERISALDRASAHPAAPEVVAWAMRLGAAIDDAALARAALPGWARAVAGEARGGAGLAAHLAGAARPSEVDRLLAAAPPPTAVGALACGAAAVADWWASDRAPTITGTDLVSEGVPPGPAIGRALAAVRAAVLDGEVGGRADQLAFALRVARGDG